MSRPIPELEGVTHRYVEVRGLRMHIAEAGAPEGDPVVLLHGWPQHWYAWRKLIAPLAERYRVVCPDLRGFGWSDAPSRGYDKHELALDVIAMTEVLGLERIRLGGHDWGAFVAYLIAFERPELVSHLLAAGFSHPWVRPQGGPLARARDLSRLYYMLALAAPVVGPNLIARTGLARQALLRGAARPRQAWMAGELETFVEQWREPERAAASAGVYRTFLTRELPRLARGGFGDSRIDVPAVLLVGEEDPVIASDNLGGFERNAPQMTIELLAGTGHWVLEEAPDRTLEIALGLFDA